MTLEELRAERHAKAKAAREILTKAEAEGRDLGREERARFDALDNEIGDLDRRMAAAGHGDDSGQLRAGELAGIAQGAPAARREGGFVLGREERMADWQARRGVRGGGGDFAADEASGFSLGRLVQRMAGHSIGGDDLEQRALAAGADSTGGVLVPESLASFVIDRIRPQARVLEAGAQVVPMDSDELSIPRIASGVQGGWRLENAPVQVADMAFERIKLTARTLAVLVKLPMEMWEDVRPEGARAIENELTQALALELDRVALRGSGVAPEPRGVRNQAGVEIQSLGVNGLVVANFDPLVRAVGGVMRDSFTPNAAIYSPRTWRTPWPASLTGSSRRAATRPTTRSSSPTRARPGRSVRRRSSGATAARSRPHGWKRATDSTICATRSGRAWLRPGCRCARCKSGWDTATSRRRSATPTTRRAHTRQRWWRLRLARPRGGRRTRLPSSWRRAYVRRINRRAVVRRWPAGSLWPCATLDRM